MSNLTITLFRYKGNPDKPGYSSFDRISTLRELETEFTAVLATLPWEDGEYTVNQAYEWLNTHREMDDDAPVFDGKPTDGAVNVSFRHGGSEGYLIDMILFDYRTETYTTLLTAKFLSYSDDLWKAMKALTDAINQGYYS